MEAILIRRELTDVQWARISNLVPGKKGDRGRAGKDNRLFLEAVRVEPARSVVEAVLRTHAPVVEHDMVDPEHGSFAPFRIELAHLLRGELPRLHWTFDFEDVQPV